MVISKHYQFYLDLDMDMDMDIDIDISFELCDCIYIRFIKLTYPIHHFFLYRY